MKILCKKCGWGVFQTKNKKQYCSRCETITDSDKICKQCGDDRFYHYEKKYYKACFNCGTIYYKGKPMLIERGYYKYKNKYLNIDAVHPNPIVEQLRGKDKSNFEKNTLKNYLKKVDRKKKK